MPASVTSITPRRSTGAAGSPATPRRPFRDNPGLILGGIAVLASALVALLVAASRTPRLSPDFLSEFVLYGVTAADLTMLVALVFVLARNVIKLVVERRRALPFARFRSKLVAVLMGMTIVPAVLVLIVGSELIRTSVERWFNAPMDEVLSSANQIAGDYYHERQLLVTDHANRIAKGMTSVNLSNPDVRPIRDLLAPEVTSQRVRMIAVYRVEPPSGSLPGLVPVVDVAAPSLPAGYRHAAADRLAAQALSGLRDTRSIETLGATGDLLHAAAVVRSVDGRPIGVIVATDYLTGELAARSRRMTQAFESYNQMRVLKRPLTGFYLSFFLMVTLCILVGATWVGLYLAKGITRPVQDLAAAAREIGAGRLDQRVEARSNDEFGSLVDAFNAMAGRACDEPAPRRAVHARPRTPARRRRKPAPLYRDDSRADHRRRRLGRCVGHGDDGQQRRSASVEPGSNSRRPAGHEPCSTARIFTRSARCCLRAAGRRPSLRFRRSRCRAEAANCSWPPSQPP